MLPHLTRSAGLTLALAACSPPAAKSLDRPNRVVVAGDGTVWVSDFQHDRLVHWSAEGTFLGEWGGNGLGRDELWRVTAMARTPTGLVVANLRPQSDESDAEVVTELKSLEGDRESGATVLDGRTLQSGARINGLVVRPGGNYVLADSTHGELVEVSTDGNHVGRFGSIPRPDAEPYNLASAGEDVWVVERDRHRITIVGPRGGDRTFTPADQPLRFPTSAAVCTSAELPWVVVADHGSHRIRRFLLDGTPLGAFSPHPDGPDRPPQLLDVAVSPDCSTLYVVDSKGDRVLVTDPNGTERTVLRAW